LGDWKGNFVNYVLDQGYDINSIMNIKDKFVEDEQRRRPAMKEMMTVRRMIETKA
jgi:hypothetical protein